MLVTMRFQQYETEFCLLCVHVFVTKQLNKLATLRELIRGSYSKQELGFCISLNAKALR